MKAVKMSVTRIKRALWDNCWSFYFMPCSIDCPYSMRDLIPVTHPQPPLCGKQPFQSCLKISKKVLGVSTLILQNPYLCWAHSRNLSVPSNSSFKYILDLRFEGTSVLFSSITVIKSIANFLFSYCMLVLLCGHIRALVASSLAEI